METFMIKKNNLKLGIIGGAGPLASSTLYRIFIQAAQQQYGAYEDRDFPEIIIINFPFSPMLSQQASTTNNQLISSELQTCFNQLATINVSHAVIACNTLHTFMHQINQHKITLISLVQTVVITIQSYRNVLILGTEKMIKAELYTAQLINTSSCSDQDQETISTIIERVLRGEKTDLLAPVLAAYINRLSAASPIDAVILGCTELSEINQHSPLHNYLTNKNITIIDPLELVVQAMLKVAYE